MATQKTFAEVKDVDFEDKLWKAVDKLGKKVEVLKCEYAVLGLVFRGICLLLLTSVGKRWRGRFLNPESEEYIAYEEFLKQTLEYRDHYLKAGVKG